MQLSVNWSEQAIIDVLPSVEYLFELLERSFTNMETTTSWKGKTVLEGTIDGITYRTVLKGSDLVYSDLSGKTVLTGGDVESYDMGRIEGGKFISLAFVEGEATLASDIFNAVQAEATTDTGALEDLFMNIGWQYNGTDLNDIFLRGTTSADGTAITLAGNDRVKLSGGDDNFFLGKGNDRAAGGDGADRIYGAGGRDRLQGNSGADYLNGGTGNDILKGGRDNDRLVGLAGDDVLFGGSGNDRLIGGTGNDVMSGDLGVDTFIFSGDSGADRIEDYEVGIDRVKINSTSEKTFEVVESGLLVSWDTSSVLIVGAASELDITFV
ncbi:MAG: hypothetical protein KUG74_09375 [Rhodobacteraceae bacterium]|nr:hypothetical protein [Paracoccaceae bacterium]